MRASVRSAVCPDPTSVRASPSPACASSTLFCSSAPARTVRRMGPAPARPPIPSPGLLFYPPFLPRPPCPNIPRRGPGPGAPARDFQRRLGQPVGRVETGRAKTAGREGVRKAFESLVAYGLGPVVGDAPTAQIQCRALLGADAADAQVVGEIGPTAVRHAVSGNGLKPAQRSL